MEIESLSDEEFNNLLLMLKSKSEDDLTLGLDIVDTLTHNNDVLDSIYIRPPFYRYIILRDTLANMSYTFTLQIPESYDLAMRVILVKTRFSYDI